MVIKKPSRRSIRLAQWDYSEEGYYFVTICSYQQMLLFGSVGAIYESAASDNIKMQLNQYGKIVNNVWRTLPNRFPISLDYYQIMPNHIRGIINILDNNCRGLIYQTRNNYVGYVDRHAGAINCAPTLGSIIRYFKAKSTRLSGIKLWQRNYYEHVIRHEKELNQIREYILNNPARWQYDRNNPINITEIGICEKL